MGHLGRIRFLALSFGGSFWRSLAVRRRLGGCLRCASGPYLRGEFRAEFAACWHGVQALSSRFYSRGIPSANRNVPRAAKTDCSPIHCR